MKIKIEQRHIDRGIPAKPRDCAVALAITEQFPAIWKVLVAPCWVDFYDFENNHVELLHSSSAPVKFDMGQLTPCEIDIPIPDWALPKPKPTTTETKHEHITTERIALP